MHGELEAPTSIGGIWWEHVLEENVGAECLRGQKKPVTHIEKNADSITTRLVVETDALQGKALPTKRMGR